MPIIQPDVTYRNVSKSESLENLIRDKTAKLDKVCDHLMSCRVAIESPHAHQQSGRPYRVRIDMRVPPGHELAVTKETSQGDMHVGVEKVVRDAFDAALRQLKKVMGKQRGNTKEHPQQEASALVEKLFPTEGYGFLRTITNRDVYFHKNSLVNRDFDELEVGDGVRFVEEAGEKGPQASAVQVVEKPAGT
jgi:cold shock CspA family protein